MTLDQFHRVSKALADPQRFALLERLSAAKEVACQQLVEALPVTQAMISHHIKELHYAGLVKSRREGKCMHFSIDRKVMNAYHAELARRLSPRKTATKRRGS